MEKNTKYDFIRDIITKKSSGDIIKLWNDYASENDTDDYVYDNDSYFFDDYFTSPDDAVRATFYGHYKYNDAYVRFNGYGNLDSFNYWDDEYSPVDISILAEWIADNLDDDRILESLGIEDDDILDVFREATDDDSVDYWKEGYCAFFEPKEDEKELN